MVPFRYLAWPPSCPPLQLGVWTGQRGQHGDEKEGRLCPARPPGRPEGKEAWRVLEWRKRVSGKKTKKTTTTNQSKKHVHMRHSLLRASSNVVCGCFFSPFNLLLNTALFYRIFVFVTHFPLLCSFFSVLDLFSVSVLYSCELIEPLEAELKDSPVGSL